MELIAVCLLSLPSCVKISLKNKLSKKSAGAFILAAFFSITQEHVLQTIL